MAKVECRISCQIEQKQQLESFLNSYKRALKLEQAEMVLDAYSRIQGQYQAWFSIQFEEVDPEQLVRKTLQVAHLLSNDGNWLTSQIGNKKFDYEFKPEKPSSLVSWAKFKLTWD